MNQNLHDQDQTIIKKKYPHYKLLVCPTKAFENEIKRNHTIRGHIGRVKYETT